MFRWWQSPRWCSSVSLLCGQYGHSCLSSSFGYIFVFVCIWSLLALMAKLLMFEGSVVERKSLLDALKLINSASGMRDISLNKVSCFVLFSALLLRWILAVSYIHLSLPFFVFFRRRYLLTPTAGPSPSNFTLFLLEDVSLSAFRFPFTYCWYFFHLISCCFSLIFFFHFLACCIPFLLGFVFFSV